MDVISILPLIYPDYVKAESSVLDMAISLGLDHVPKCLPPEKQQLAAAYYTAYSLAQHFESKINPQGLSSEREGDLSVSYSLEHRKSTQFLAKWQELNVICERMGAITVGFNNVGY